MKESCKEVKNEHLLLFIVPWILLDPSPSCFSIGTMEDGGVDRTVMFEITRTIYSNSERSDQILVTVL